MYALWGAVHICQEEPNHCNIEHQVRLSLLFHPDLVISRLASYQLVLQAVWAKGLQSVLDCLQNATNDARDLWHSGLGVLGALSRHEHTMQVNWTPYGQCPVCPST